jgi:hypothetical protein
MQDPLRLTITICKHRLVSHYLPKLLICLDGLNDHFLWKKGRNDNSLGGIILHVLEHVKRNKERIKNPLITYDKGIEEYFPNREFSVVELREMVKHEFNTFEKAISTENLEKVNLHSILHLVEHTGYHLGQIVDRTQQFTGRKYQFVQNGISEKNLIGLIEEDMLEQE